MGQFGALVGKAEQRKKKKGAIGVREVRKGKKPEGVAAIGVS